MARACASASCGGVYLVPLMLGTRNVAFPRLNAYGYWVYLIGAALLVVGFILFAGSNSLAEQLTDDTDEAEDESTDE